MIKVNYYLCNYYNNKFFKQLLFVVTVDMDFSNFNAAEQAHMTKVIEKRQVSTYLSTYFQPTSQTNRCKTFSECIPTSLRNASTLAVTTSQARPCHQKRSFFHLTPCRMDVHLF